MGLGRVGGRTRLSQEAYRALINAGTSSVGCGVRVAVVATGHHPLVLERLVRGDDVGTLFTSSAPAARL